MNYLTRYLNPNNTCEAKSTELIKHLNEKKLEKLTQNSWQNLTEMTAAGISKEIWMDCVTGLTSASRIFSAGIYCSQITAGISRYLSKYRYQYQYFDVGRPSAVYSAGGSVGV